MGGRGLLVAGVQVFRVEAGKEVFAFLRPPELPETYKLFLFRTGGNALSTFFDQERDGRANPYTFAIPVRREDGGVGLALWRFLTCLSAVSVQTVEPETVELF